jgi:solute carrier family 25 carnitine/acylcarnitine transporter 20/29
MEYAEYFLCGLGYGLTNVIVGQPFDTIKTRQQTLPGASTLKFVRDEGLRGLYRGGGSIIVGGAMMRSAQFGIYGSVLSLLRGRGDTSSAKVLGVIDPNIVVAGFCGGISRGIIEGPFEYIKVRRQVDKPWYVSEMLSGMGATVFRNAFLFSSFVIYIDISRQVVPGGFSPFVEGAVCSNLAWLTIWPLDVVKSQLQSGNYTGKSFTYLLSDVIRTGKFFNGIVPGLVRSSIANGCSMVVYRKVQDWFAAQRLKDLNSQ